MLQMSPHATKMSMSELNPSAQGVSTGRRPSSSDKSNETARAYVDEIIRREDARSNLPFLLA